MPSPPPPFLCEHCGYDLSATVHDARCPECGTPVAESLPGARPGMPIQQRFSLRNWQSTVHGVLTHPNALFQSAILDGDRVFGFMLLNFAISITIPFGIIAGAETVRPLTYGWDDGGAAITRAMLEILFNWIISLAIGSAILMVLTGVLLLVIVLVARCLGVRADSSAPTLVLMTSSAALVPAALGFSSVVLMFAFMSRTAYIIALLTFAASCFIPVILWIRSVYQGLIALRYANPLPAPACVESRLSKP
ncbi:MAG TPA: hypothetical protein VG797_08300 [Phycisphaerales bacterium]|nr:hypothetical protein [Phycisphaerales bacterium]